MTRAEQLNAMAHACVEHLSKDDAMLVALTTLDNTERMVAYLNAGHRKNLTGPEFAAFALSCAKRVIAGPES